MVKYFLLFQFVCLTVSPAFAEAYWALQLGTGSAYSFDSPLTIKQDGEQTLDFTAEWETKAWSTQAIYYDLRLGKWENGRAWEIETLHHKLHLKNNPPEVQSFVISHGYNLCTVNYAVLKEGIIYRIGAGVVVTHPETEVRGKKDFDDGGLRGFYLSGVTAQVAVEKRFEFPDSKWFFSLEGKLTASYAEVPIADGDATVPNVAVHGIFGVGYNF